MKKLLSTLLLIILGNIMGFARDYNPVLLTQEEYAQFKYTWTDKDNVVHESDITEKAESPEQIMALIKEVYGNPEIPGTWYAEPTKELGVTPYGEQPWGITGQKPTKEGYTLLLVAVKDTWTGSTSAKDVLNYIKDAIKWVKLVPNAVRMTDDSEGPNKAGVLFNVDESLNRFYIMTKGKNRASGGTPFYRMFELYSPTIATGTITNTEDFYKKMMDGEVYDVLHDCGTVEGLQHYFSMTGREGTDSKQMTGLVFYIPDYRYESWSGRDINGQYTWYNPSFCPKTLMYTVTLRAAAKRAVTTDGSRKYDVTLDWESSLDRLAPGGKLPQEFDIYLVVNGVRQSEPIATHITDYTYTYQVPQELKGYDITYQISARPVNTEFNKAWSNTDMVTIPGYDPFERLNLSIVGNYKSTYDQSREVNEYENLITMTNNTADPTTALKGNMIDETTKFELYRFDDEVENPEQVHIATVHMAAKQQVSEGEWHFPYTVEYYATVGGVKYPATSGYFTAESEDGVLTLGAHGLQLMDAFSASTKYNDHPDHYDYQVKFVSAIDIVAPDGVTKSRDAYSNITRVPVYKTSIEVGVPVYTQEQVIDDVDHNLDLSTAAVVDIKMNNYSNVKDYLVRRDAKSDVGLVQKNQDGSYTSFRRDETGFNTVIDRKEFEGEHLTMTLEDDGRDVTKAESTSYVGIVEAYTKNTVDETVISTYGSDIKRVEMANMEINITNDGHKNVFGPYGYQVSNPLEINGEMVSGYFFNLDLTSFLSEALSVCGDGDEVPNYRVWRVVDGRETLIAGDQLTVTGKNGVWTYGYRYWPGEDNNKLLIQDFFMGKPIANKGNGEVNYIARVYAKAQSGARMGVKLAEDDGACYYVAENSIGVRFVNDGVVTGINDIDATRAVSSVVYINPQGIKSATPFDGLNIVVTRYGDGTTTTTRIVK